MWYSELKYLRIGALVKAFHKCMKAFLTLEVKKIRFGIDFCKIGF